MKRTNNTFATLNRNDVDAIFTAKVTELVAQGYTINPATMSGSEGEIAKVDLRKGNDLLRVWMSEDRDFLTDIRTLHIRIGRCNDANCLRAMYGGIGATVWNDHLETIEDIELATIDPRKGVFTSVEDGKAIERLRFARLRAREDRCWGSHTDDVTSPATRAIALKYIQRQPRMKSCKLTDIEHVYRITDVARSGGQPTFDSYRIYAKGKSFTLKPAKA